MHTPTSADSCVVIAIRVSPLISCLQLEAPCIIAELTRLDRYTLPRSEPSRISISTRCPAAGGTLAVTITSECDDAKFHTLRSAQIQPSYPPHVPFCKSAEPCIGRRASSLARGYRSATSSNLTAKTGCNRHIAASRIDNTRSRASIMTSSIRGSCWVCEG